MPSNLLRLFHTVRHLRPRQVIFQVYYRMTGKLTVNKGALTQVQSDGVESSDRRPVTFDFLNRPVTFPSPAEIDWNYPELGKLWTYNLNYFEFLTKVDPRLGRSLIQHWIANETTHRDGWEPYPTSLRLVEWIRFYPADSHPGPPDYVRQSSGGNTRRCWARSSITSGATTYWKMPWPSRFPRFTWRTKRTCRVSSSC